MMKPDALLVNTSRGGVIDEEALYQALKEHKIGGAALDVLDREPFDTSSPLFKLDNVIFTPHLAAFSADFEKNFWDYSAAKLLSLQEQFAGNNSQTEKR
jgi:phosphoglycerate dehydrogenase-like enzyme